MKRTSAYILILCALSWFGASGLMLAQSSSGEGTAGAKFLSIAVGSRAVAMGDAFVAVANDASSLYWNPAGASFLQNNALILNHINWFADIKHDYVGSTFSIGDGTTIGASFTFMTMPDQEITTVQQPEGTGLTYGASSFAFGLTFARRLTEDFALGVTGKYVREQIWEAAASNIGFDLGALYDIGYQDLTIGLSILNLGANMRFGGRSLEGQFERDDWPLSKEPLNYTLNTNDYALPLRMSLGLSKKIGFSPEANALLAISVNNNNDLGETYSGGVEYAFRSFALRGGYRSGYNDVGDGAGFSAGAGYQFHLNSRSKMILDYAYHHYGILDSINRFTLQFTF